MQYYRIYLKIAITFLSKKVLFLDPFFLQFYATINFGYQFFEREKRPKSIISSVYNIHDSKKLVPLSYYKTF